MIVLFSILIPILLIFSGFAKAICDLSEEGNLKFKADFWHKNIAWKNKWKNGDKSQGEKFFGSSRWFVALTDAWHLFGLLFRLTFASTFLLIGILGGWWLFGAIVAYIIFAGTFHIFHTTKILK